MADISSSRSLRPLRRLLKKLSSGEEATVERASQPLAVARTAQLPNHQRSEAALMVSESCDRGLWDEAYDAVLNNTCYSQSHEALKRLRLELDVSAPLSRGGNHVSSSQLFVCEEVLRLTLEKQRQIEKNTGGLTLEATSRAKKAYAGIAFWVQKFVSIGDLMAQLDPVHVGLPWAGVRLILVMSIHSFQNSAAVVEGIAHVSKLIYRYAIFEEVYLESTHLPRLMKTQLQLALKELYTAILLYIIRLNKQINQSTGGRILSTITLNDAVGELAKDVEAKEKEVLNYERIAIRSASHAQYLEVRSILGAYDDHLQAEQRARISDWVSTIPYHAHHKDVHDRVLSGTGQWFLNRSEFREWQDSLHSSLLWLRGDAGTGKSSLIACIIERFLQAPRLNSSEAFAYFYCSRTSGSNERQDPRDILKSIIRQLAAPLAGLPIKAPLISRYKQDSAMGSREAHFNIRECSNLITELVAQHYSHITIVLDALDECDPKTRAELLPLLSKLACGGDTKVKLLISSRNELDIFDYFGGSSNLYINAEDNADDICKFVNHEIDSRLLHGNSRELLRTLVKEELNRKAQGMFRWAALQIDSLCDPDYVHTPEDVEDLLRTLPETLEATYAETMEKLSRYPKSSRFAIFNALKLLICAEYPMNTKTLLGAVALLQGKTWTGLEGADLIRMSRSLIIKDRQRPMLKFAHLSVREYLERQVEFSGEFAHAAAAEACLKVFIMSTSSSAHDPKETATVAKLQAAREYLHRYAVKNLGRHCQKSGSKRQQDPLQQMVTHFFVNEDGRRDFDEWNNACFRTGLSISPTTSMEWINCSSRPAQPLLMACVYGFIDIAELIVAQNLRALEAETFQGLNPLEAAAHYGNYNIVVMLYHKAAVTRNKSIRAGRLWHNAAHGTSDVVRFLLDQNLDLPIEAEVTVFQAAASNKTNGPEIVKHLLKRVEHLSDDVIKTIIERSASITTIRLLLLHIGEITVTESIIMAAVNNSSIGAPVVEIFLQQATHLTITEEVFVSSAIRMDRISQSEVIECLLAHPKRCIITEEMLCKIALHGRTSSRESLRLLFETMPGFKVTEDLLVAAVSNRMGGYYLLKFLLEYNGNCHITQRVLESAMRNDGIYTETLRILLDCPGCPGLSEGLVYILLQHMTFDQYIIQFIFERSEKLQITETIMRNVARYFAPESMSYLLTEQSRSFPISPNIIRAGFRNWTNSLAVTKMLFEHSAGLQFDLIEDDVVDVIQTNSSGLSVELLKYLVGRCGYLPVNERVINAATKCRDSAKILLEFIEKTSGPIKVTQDTLEDAASNDDPEVIEYLLHREEDVEISESIVKFAIKPQNTNNAVLKVLLSHPSNFHVTQSVLEEAAEYGSQSTFEILLDRSSLTILPPTAIDLAARNYFHGESILRYIASRQALLVTEDTLIMAASNRQSGLAVLKYLLSSPERQQIVTERVLRAALISGEMAHLILCELNLKIEITPETLKAAISKSAEPPHYSLAMGTRVLKLLLPRLKQPIRVPEVLLEVAAERQDGKFIIQYLLTEFGEIPVTQTAIEAAAANETAGVSVMKTLLQQPGVSLHRGAFLAAARNVSQGTSMMQLLLEYSGNRTELSEEVINAALSNSVCGNPLLTLFLSRDLNFPITEGVIDSAAANNVFGKVMIVKFLHEAILRSDEQLKRRLINKIKSNPKGIQDLLFMAACEGNEQLVKFLLTQYVDLTAKTGEIGTVLDVAVFAGNLEVVQLLLEHGADFRSSNSLRGSVLQVACDREYFDIGRCLVEYGADVDQTNSVGRTPLHCAIRKGNNAAIEILIELGASVTKTDYQKLSALHHAAWARRDINERLLQLTPSINEEDSFKWTPLHWAARVGSQNAAEQLVQAGARKTDVDFEGHTPFKVATLFRHRHIQAQLWDPSAIKADIVEHMLPTDDYICDGCELIICGPRYRCENCPEYPGFDLCFRCIVDVLHIHDQSHKLMLVK